MHIMMWLLVGGLAGWIASMLRPEFQDARSISVDVLVGVAGALLSVWLVAPRLGLPPIEAQIYSPLNFFVALAGAALALGAVQLWRQRSAR